MDHYLEIKIKPDAEMPANVLLNKLYSKFHKALCQLRADDIGVSFPDYRILLGQRLRIHATVERLQQMEQLDWLGDLSGYCAVSQIIAVPQEVSYRTVSRIQQNMTFAKLRRLIRRGTIPEADIKAYKAKMCAEGLSEPYLELDSSSTGQKHRRYLSFGDLQSRPVNGFFDTFGLSKQATIPWF